MEMTLEENVVLTEEQQQCQQKSHQFYFLIIQLHTCNIYVKILDSQKNIQRKTFELIDNENLGVYACGHPFSSLKYTLLYICSIRDNVISGNLDHNISHVLRP